MPGVKTAVKHTPSDLRDLKRDWDGWSAWERRAATALAVASFAASVFWLAMSVGMMF